MNIENFISDDLLNKTVESAPSYPVRGADVLSFKQTIPAMPVEIIPSADKPAKKRFIMRSLIIDKFTTKRTRIELTPSVCDVCAFDVAAAKHGNWHHVPDYKKVDVLEALVEHKREAHPMKEDLIINEDELPTAWLGSKDTTL